MWHLKTKIGTFWILEGNFNSKQGYILGIDDEELTTMSAADEAAEKVYNQETGFYKWDTLTKIKVPEDIEGWKMGEPDSWN